MAIVFKQPLVFRESTGTTVDPNNTELFGKVAPSQTTTFSIGQAVGTGSAVVFDELTGTTEKFIIGDDTLILSGSSILGSFGLAGSATISNDVLVTNNMTVQGIVTAEKIETEFTQSVNIFASGSTIFGDTPLDDTHQFTGSLRISDLVYFVYFEK